MPPVVDSKKCTGCGVCADRCPEDVLGIAETNRAPEVRYPEECWHCAACVVDCPKDAISMYIRLPMRLYKKMDVSIPCITNE
jgi:MinD superfamily P-loop ATPase containing an inserted ferredoxin domain